MCYIMGKKTSGNRVVLPVQRKINSGREYIYKKKYEGIDNTNTGIHVGSLKERKQQQ